MRAASKKGFSQISKKNVDHFLSLYDTKYRIAILTGISGLSRGIFVFFLGGQTMCRRTEYRSEKPVGCPLLCGAAKNGEKEINSI
jgi:hypothetical protein